MDVRVGDYILTKKEHPCKNNEFLVLRVGMDFKIQCTKCERQVMLPRAKIEKNIKKLRRGGEDIPLRQPQKNTECKDDADV